MWPCTYSMDVPHGRIDEIIENLCLEHGKAQG